MCEAWATKKCVMLMNFSILEGIPYEYRTSSPDVILKLVNGKIEGVDLDIPDAIDRAHCVGKSCVDRE